MSAGIFARIMGRRLPAGGKDAAVHECGQDVRAHLSGYNDYLDGGNKSGKRQKKSLTRVQED